MLLLLPLGERVMERAGERTLERAGERIMERAGESQQVVITNTFNTILFSTAQLVTKHSR